MYTCNTGGMGRSIPTSPILETPTPVLNPTRRRAAGRRATINRRQDINKRAWTVRMRAGAVR